MRRWLTDRVSALFIDRRQRRGLLGLTLVLMTIIWVRKWQAEWAPYHEEGLTLQVTHRIADSIVFKHSARNGGMQTRSGPKSVSTGVESEAYFSFDPNTVSDSGWIAMGLSQAQVNVIRKYQKAGGQFRKPEDVSRLYTLPDGWYERHQDDIHIPAQHTNEAEHQAFASSGNPSEVAEVQPLIHLNTADSAQLVAIRGVGPSSAVRILRFREALGGFISKAQLNEVWGLHPNVRDRLLEVTHLDSTHVSRILLDTSGIRTLAAHPYISYSVARALVNYRRQHGPFKKVGDIRRSHLVNDSLAARIEPYLYVRSRTQRVDTLEHP